MRLGDSSESDDDDSKSDSSLLRRYDFFFMAMNMIKYIQNINHNRSMPTIRYVCGIVVWHSITLYLMFLPLYFSCLMTSISLKALIQLILIL